jgi:hypothetical protein
MFAQALARVEAFTLPILFSRRRVNGNIESGIGTFMVVNREGWVITAAHLAKEFAAFERDRVEVEAYNRARAEIEGNGKLHPNDKKKRLRELKAAPHWITHMVSLWGNPAWRITVLHVDEFSDVAVGRLEGFDPASVAHYPVFKRPTQPMLPGTSLCRVGFPFTVINATFDAATGQFRLDERVLPIPRFPNDGIHTRIAIQLDPNTGRRVKFVETSSAGLLGQSGGPIFDVHGHVWALQSKTQSLPLGFKPVVQDGDRRIVEHQFMHVGWGSHVEEILSMLNQNNVAHELS